jgi:hypothetical protein
MKRPVVIALLVATGIKILFVCLTIGTNDVVTWSAFTDSARLCGECVYYIRGPYGDPFNHPPFIIHFLKLLSLTGESFPFWLRLPAVLADVGSLFLLVRILPNVSTSMLVLVAVNPISILVSGFHGNTDPVMILFVLLAIYLLKLDRIVLAGMAFGMAVNVKLVPVLFVPSHLIYLNGSRQRVVFTLVALVTFALASLPYLARQPLIIEGVLGYRGMFNNWGISHYSDLAGAHHALASPFRYLTVLVAALIPVFLKRRASLFICCAAVVFSFYALTPSLALQYLAWGVPFAAVLKIRVAGFYYFLGGALIALQYHRWSGGRWIYADSHSVLPATPATEFLSFVLWVGCIAFFYLTVRMVDRRAISNPAG